MSNCRKHLFFSTWISSRGCVIASLAFAVMGVSALTEAPADKTVPESNRTSLNLYVTPQEAYDMWKANPDTVHIIDVRSFEEYIFVGHANMAQNIPVIFPKFEKPDTQETPPKGKIPAGCSGVPNNNFITSVKAQYSADDTIMVMCSTGGRAAMAANQLAKAGYTNVYNIINGLEGDLVDDPGSVYHGKRMRNGWKNNGLPWTYAFDPELMWIAPEN